MQMSFNNFMLAKELFANVLQSFETCVKVMCETYVETYSHHKRHLMNSFKVTSVPFFIPDFNLLSCKLDCI